MRYLRWEHYPKINAKGPASGAGGVNLRLEQAQINTIPGNHLQNQQVAVFFIVTLCFKGQGLIAGGNEIPYFAFLGPEF